ncbi:FimD/PapC N-terminal domain-containing protein [Providencia rettgeri]|uniref:FimD/PapC N-terminal domain-containing protein n=1 Tax=Providencia rettgeri TaxID=587 RepID=A0A939NB77_PRORE|nr:FimD/PapC N-terminal domain-containing protein [Providencia rettgeri]
MLKLSTVNNMERIPFNASHSRLLKIIPYASSHFDFNQQRLYLSFPQASLTNLAKGTIDPSMWDEGIRTTNKL